MWLVSSALPALTLHLPMRHALAVVLEVLGACITVAGVVGFRWAGTTVNPLRPQAASALVTSGVYRWTRNPMYLGMLLGLAGGGVYLAHGLAWLLLPLFVAYMNRFQIRVEERALSERFGAAYTRYKHSVRRWL